MENEETQDASAHYDFLEFVLSVYGKEMRNVVALIGYNESTNRAFSRLIGQFLLDVIAIVTTGQ